MTSEKIRFLILACGNTLCNDDGFGPWLAQWAEDRFQDNAEVQIISRHQWTPELAEEVAQAQSVLFIDCSVESVPGVVRLRPVEPAPDMQSIGTHQVDAAELLAMALYYYNSLPARALQLTVGAGSTELGEEFSPAVTAALPEACRLLEETVTRYLSAS
jgi:hydrogenase maturation protease